MLFKESICYLDSVKSKVAATKVDLNSQRDRSKNTSSGIKNIIRRLSIAKKISYSYSLAIGIAILGTTVGLAIGDYQEKKAQEQLRVADEQEQLLRDVESAVGRVRSHPQRLISVIEKSILFEYETSKFLGEVTKFNAQLSNLAKFIDKQPSNLAVDATEFKNLLNGYQTTTELYTQLVKALWKQINPGTMQPEEIAAARQLVLVSTSGKTAIQIDFEFERLTESLNRLIAAAQTQQKQANDRLKEATALRQLLIVGSMLLSAAIAAALALITSRAIARPLESVTQVAQQVTQNANFDLQAPVTTEDEVGSLATSLNQLIKWVGEYTHQLELGRHTLETRVEERTQELTVALQDLKQTQSQLIQTEKMSSLGQLVAGVAHEINNPVNFIHGNIGHAKEYTEDLIELVHLYQQHYPNPTPAIQDQIEEMDLDFLAEDLSKLLSSMRMGTERIRQIVLSLRNFSRLDEADMKAVDIHEGIENTLLILNSRIKQGIEVINKYEDLPKIECYAAQLNQVFMNIIANGIDALQDKKDQPSKQIVIQTERVDSNQIRVSIRDNGSGIPLEIIDKLFDPFFTTKPVGKGTGLGLSICYQIIEKHKGKIEVNSEPGQGTEFAIALPIQQNRTMSCAANC